MEIQLFFDVITVGPEMHWTVFLLPQSGQPGDAVFSCSVIVRRAVNVFWQSLHWYS